MRWQVGEEEEGGRFDRTLADYLDGVSRSEVSRKIKEGKIFLNGEKAKASTRLSFKDEISLDPEIFELPAIKPEKVDLKVLYQDQDMMVVNKPAGMVVHPTQRIRSGTLVNALLGLGTPLSDRYGDERPGIVHRLDAGTSGAILLAKTNQAHDRLADQFRQRKVAKLYLAIVHGRMEVHDLEVKAPIGRPSGSAKMEVTPLGKEAISRFDSLAHGRDSSLVAVRILTGRTHQIRVHLAWYNHPVVGDPVYGPRKGDPHIDHQLLHAYRLGFHQPTTGEWKEVQAQPDEDFFRALARHSFSKDLVEQLKKGDLC